MLIWDSCYYYKFPTFNVVVVVVAVIGSSIEPENWRIMENAMGNNDIEHISLIRVVHKFSQPITMKLDEWKLCCLSIQVDLCGENSVLEKGGKSKLFQNSFKHNNNKSKTFKSHSMMKSLRLTLPDLFKLALMCVFELCWALKWVRFLSKFDWVTVCRATPACH